MCTLFRLARFDNSRGMIRTRRISANSFPKGPSHLAFFVEDIDNFYTETSAKGLRFNNEPAALHDESGKLLRKALYAQDPDGNWLEFVELF